MTPRALALLHAKAFAPQRGWSESEFTSLCARPHAHLFSVPEGFALVQVVAGEAELLTLAVDPEHRREGIAERLMRDWMAACPAKTAFLEVAADNAPAIALYAKCGFQPVGKRKAYYARENAAPVDALLMQATLTPRWGGQSTA